MMCRTANTTQGELVAGFELVSEMEGCNCCLVSPDLMIGDGERHRELRGHDMLCHRGDLVRLSNDKVDHRLEVKWKDWDYIINDRWWTLRKESHLTIKKMKKLTTLLSNGTHQVRFYQS